MRAVGVTLSVLMILAILAVSILGLIFWIFKLVEVARLPEYQFAAAGSEKTVWVIVVALLGWIGALIWHFAKRKDVLAMAGRVPMPAPGWYPDPGGAGGAGGQRWWDGARWTEHRH